MRNLGPTSNSLSRLSQEEWEELWRRLRLYTWKRFRWLNDRTGEDLDAIAHQAIVDTWTGKRRWPPLNRLTGLENDKVTLFVFLCETVRSLVSHVWEREKVRISFDDAPSSYSLNDREFIEKLLGITYEKNAFYAAPHKVEALADYDGLTRLVLRIVEDDAPLISIVHLWCSDPDLKPSQIAVSLKLTMPEMQAAQKRLRRLLLNWKRSNEQKRR
jgi:hypothetical protein